MIINQPVRNGGLKLFKAMQVKRVFIFEKNDPGRFLSLEKARNHIWQQQGKDAEAYNGDHLLTVNTKTDEVIAVRRVSIKGPKIRLSLI